MSFPVLYSYRRCPYAIRARMALKYANIPIEINEIELTNKPVEMLKVSPKGTVPVLVLEDGRVIDQSLDIMYWALQQNDIDGWLAENGTVMEQLIVENDGVFKQALDKYKYLIRSPNQNVELYRRQGEFFFQKLEGLLNHSVFLVKDEISLADIAIFPFIRQFVSVDKIWFEEASYPKIRAWLNHLVKSQLFNSVMEKQPP